MSRRGSITRDRKRSRVILVESEETIDTAPRQIGFASPAPWYLLNILTAEELALMLYADHDYVLPVGVDRPGIRMAEARQVLRWKRMEFRGREKDRERLLIENSSAA